LQNRAPHADGRDRARIDVPSFDGEIGAIEPGEVLNLSPQPSVHDRPVQIRHRFPLDHTALGEDVVTRRQRHELDLDVKRFELV
jgi:hypothetical protein